VAIGALVALAALYVILAVLPAAEGSNLILATEPPIAGAGRSPDWLLGPLRCGGAGGADGPLGGPLFYAGLWLALLLYALVVIRAALIPRRLAIGAIVGLHAVFLLAPPLLSQDVFSYIAYARLGVEHDLNPYTHEPNDIPGDEVFGYAGSKNAESVYGPLFTLLTYPLAPLSVAAALWTLKALAALASLGIAWLVWRTAERLGRDPVPATAFVALNPLTLVHVVGGAHNEALVMLVAMAGVYLFVARRDLAGSALATLGAGVKATAALVVPFLVLGARRGRETGSAAKALAAAGAAGLALALIALLAFGTDALDGLSVLSSNQDRSSRWSFPYKTAQVLAAVFGGERTDYTDVVRALFAAACLAVVAWLLVRTWRGEDPIRMAAWATFAVLVASAWLVPWYALWLLPLAALTNDRTLKIASVALCAWMLPIAIPL
jgi:alpha-1,6-mannosyltransferase